MAIVFQDYYMLKRSKVRKQHFAITKECALKPMTYSGGEPPEYPLLTDYDQSYLSDCNNFPPASVSVFKRHSCITEPSNCLATKWASTALLYTPINVFM